MRALAIIPARSGSKGIPNKNLKKIEGKSLISITSEAAINSECFDDIYLASDESKYFEEITRYEKVSKFTRSSEKSKDNSSIFDLLAEMNQIIERYEVVAILQPTSPLRTSLHIKEAFALYGKSTGSVVSAKPVSYKPELLLYEESGLVRKLLENHSSNRQTYRDYFELNGAIYIFNKEYIDKNTLIDEHTSIYKMSDMSSVDIDSYDDLEMARSIIREAR